MSSCRCKYRLFSYGPDELFYLGAYFNSLPYCFDAADLGKKFMMLGILGKVIRVIDASLITDCSKSYEDEVYFYKVLGDLFTVSPLTVPAALLAPFFYDSFAKEKKLSAFLLTLFPITIPVAVVLFPIIGLSLNFFCTLFGDFIFLPKFLNFMADNDFEFSWTSPFEYLYTSIIGSNDEGYCHEPLHFFD